MEPFNIALSEYGTKEIAGILHSAEVLKYSKDIGLKWVKDDETAWCAIFVNWCLWKSKRPNTGSALARSFLTYGNKTNVPQIGEIVVLWRIAKDSQYGHVGFFVKRDKQYVWILGGNQNNEVNISKFPIGQVLEYRTLVQAKYARYI